MKVDLATVGSVIISYPTHECIRMWSGSPGSLHKFSSPIKTVIVDNLGPNPAYFTFDTTTISAGSQYPLLPAMESRSFDLYCGSVLPLCSGTTGSTEVQTIGLR